MSVTQTVVRQRKIENTSTPSTTYTTNDLKSTQQRTIYRVPTEKPSFTLGDLRRAVPAHCFERSLITSFSYVLWDLLLVITLIYLSLHISTLPIHWTLQWGLWVAYWLAQGFVMTGLWVIGHECGHGGFANTTLMNDIVGFVIHSALLVPYFSWQISHRKHHSNTGNLATDEVFVPANFSKTPIDIDNNSQTSAQVHEKLNQHKDGESWYEENTFVHAALVIYRWMRILFMLTLGWPLYLLSNATGNRSYASGWKLNHFHPSSPIYADISRGSVLVLLSDIGLFSAIAALYYCSTVVGSTAVICHYVIPYLITNACLVLITFLQHSDTALPHYSADEWDWLRGALATVDRDYGILNHIFHHINDTHVTHHLFSYLPHYHAVEATEALKNVLGPYYYFNHTPIPQATYESYVKCSVIAPDAKRPGIYWF
jgi:omega-6 fatty acid desaturase (delta-12 desaturase)